MNIPDEAAAELGRSIAEAILDPKNPPRFRVERWVVDHGWVCVAKESERGWAEVAAYTGLVLYDGDYRIVDTKARTCEYYRRGGMTNSNEARETGGKLMSEPKVVFEPVGDETPLTMDTYQQQAAKTAVYPEDEAVQYLIAGLAGEVGEVASLFAKYWRGDGDFNRDHVAAELGDVLWFVAMLADEIGCDLSTVAQGNLDKLADRANRGKLKGSGDNR